MKGVPPPEAVRYAREVRQRLGEHVKQVVLFGSRARGDASDTSDYDFVVVLDTTEKAFREQISDVGVMMLNATDRLFAALVYGPDEWSSIRRSPLGWNIQREGLLL
jgi:predicted nucleotidyltransferase